MSGNKAGSPNARGIIPDKNETSAVDSAQLAVTSKAQNLGGIDFSAVGARRPDGQGSALGGNPNNFFLETQGDRAQFNIPSDPALWNNIQVNGFVPIIFDITPVNDLQLFLGILQQK